MVNTKVKTAIANQTQHELVLRVGNNNCFAKLATIADGSEHNLEIDIHWTYHEFSLEPTTTTTTAGPVLRKMIFTSDDCCDFEHMKVTICEGKLQLEKVARGQLQIEEDDDDDVVVVDPRRLPATPEVPTKRRSSFSWLPTRPKFQWKFWSDGS